MVVQITFGVKVVAHHKGKEQPMSGIVVRLSFKSWTSGGLTTSEVTDDDGEVWWTEYDYGGRAIIFVDGEDYGTYSFDEGTQITVEFK